MSNYTNLNLYLVTNGEVTDATPETEFDGIDSILVAATSPAAALRVADAYAREEVAVDNLTWQGETIAAVTMRDEGGLYA